MSAHALLQVHLLGGFRVAVGSRLVPDVAWRQRRAAAVVKLLALAPGHRLHREQVMDTLWPDLDPEAAANNLRFALHHARRQLEGNGAPADTFLTRDGQQLFLGPAAQVWIDVEVFEEAVAAAWHTSDLTVHQRVVDLYAGDLLPDDRYEDWVMSRRTALRTSYLALLGRLAELYEHHGHVDSARATWQRLVSVEPTQESAHVGLMRLYAVAGLPRQALTQYERLAQILMTEVDAEPEPATQALMTAIVNGRYTEVARTTEPVPTVASPPIEEQPITVMSNRRSLPAGLTVLIGRTRELAELRHLQSTNRLLTLTGPGGIGKTRLAIALGQQVQDGFPDGVVFVDLAPLRNPETVLARIAQTVGVREMPGFSLAESLTTFLAPKRLLLIIDNFEQVVSTAPAVAELASNCPHLSVIVTSRMRLRVRGEQEYAVGPLALPDARLRLSPEALAEYPAVMLFSARSREVRPAFRVDASNAAVVAQLCYQLDGLPLALELAAARIKILSPQALLTRLEHRFEVLTSGPRDAPPRQQTMSDTIAWSYNLLTPLEQRLLRRLSVFRGGWTLEAAESVASFPVEPGGAVVERLASLVDASLVVQQTQDDDVRFGMLESIREYAFRQLDERDERDDAGARHAAYYLALAEQANPELRLTASPTWLQRLEIEHDNFRSALSWCQHTPASADDGLRLATALWRFWMYHGHLVEGRQWLESGLRRRAEVTPTTLAWALYATGVLASQQGDFTSVRELAQESLTIMKEIGDIDGAASANHLKGIAAFNQIDLDVARACFEESLPIHHLLGNLSAYANALANLGLVNFSAGDVQEARALIEESLAIDREIHNELNAANHLNNLGEVIAALGDYELAITHFQESAMISRALGHRLQLVYALTSWGEAVRHLGDYRLAQSLLVEGLMLGQELRYLYGIARSLEQIAALLTIRGSPGQAVRLCAAAHSIREAILTPVPPEAIVGYERLLADLRHSLGDSAFSQNWSDGRAMTTDDAIAYALVHADASVSLSDSVSAR